MRLKNKMVYNALKKKEEQEVKKEVIRKLKGMTIEEAKGICEEYGWEIKEGKYFMECEEDRVVFDTDDELIDYAQSLEESR